MNEPDRNCKLAEKSDPYQYHNIIANFQMMRLKNSEHSIP
jgi:hypothetical protein